MFFLVDLQSIKKITKNDSQRIQRFLEIYLLTGNVPSSFLSSTKPLKTIFEYFFSYSDLYLPVPITINFSLIEEDKL